MSGLLDDIEAAVGLRAAVPPLLATYPCYMPADFFVGDADGGRAQVEVLSYDCIEEGLIADFDAVNRIVYGPLCDRRGSVSVERGIGLEKKPYLNYTRSDVEIGLMRHIKRTLDPGSLLNPGKMFDLQN